MKKKHIYLSVSSVIIIIALIFITLFVLSHHKSHKKENNTNSAPTTIVVSQPDKVLSSSSVFVGEVFWGRAIQTVSNRSTLKYAFPFHGLSQNLHDSVNNWIGDLECPTTTTDIPYQTQVDYLRFNCRPEYLTEAKKWFNIFTLANNHSFDNGQTGLDQTRANLQNAGIQYFGDYHDTNTDNICEVVAMNAKEDYGNGNIKDVYLPVAMCGYMLVVDQQPTADQLAVISKYSKIMPTIVMPHMGVEYRSTAESEKVKAYHSFIDAGADAVFATHPHYIQNSENYKGRLIQYSAGNFMFDQQILGLNTTLSLGVGISITIKDQHAIDVYSAVGQQCLAFKDNCLSEISAKLTIRPKIYVKYFPECFMEPNYFPETADTKTCNLIKSQATWDYATANLDSAW